MKYSFHPSFFQTGIRVRISIIFRYIKRHRRLKLMLGLSAFILVLVIVLSYVEKNSNEHFNSVFDVLYFAMVTITTVGYGDIIPVTDAGKILTVLLFSIGVVLIGLMTGMIASILTASRIREGMGLKKVELNKHVIICGYNFNLESVIGGIINSSMRSLPDIVLINTHTDSEISALIEMFPEAAIRFVHGDYTSESTLNRASVGKASAAIILADPGPDGHAKPDDRTLLATLAIKSLAREVDVCAELLDSANKEHLKRAGVDQIVLSGEFSGYLLSSAVMTPGITQALRDIMLIREGSNLRREQMPRALVGKTFRDALIEFLDRDGSVLVGIISEKKTFNMDEMLTGDQSTIDDFIRRKFEEAGRNLEIESKGRVNVLMNPGKDYLISENDFALILTPKTEEPAL